MKGLISHRLFSLERHAIELPMGSGDGMTISFAEHHSGLKTNARGSMVRSRFKKPVRLAVLVIKSGKLRDLVF